MWQEVCDLEVVERLGGLAGHVCAANTRCDWLKSPFLGSIYGIIFLRRSLVLTDIQNVGYVLKSLGARSFANSAHVFELTTDCPN